MGRVRVFARRLVAPRRRLIDSPWHGEWPQYYARGMRYLVAVCLLATNVCLAQTRPAVQPQGSPADKEAVRRAATDYLEGFYEGDTAKLVRALRPEMFKYGFFKGKEATAYAGE